MGATTKEILSTKFFDIFIHTFIIIIIIIFYILQT